MVNAQLGMGYELSQTLAKMQRQIDALSTQPVLRHASTGQDGGQGLSTDMAGLHLFNPSGAEVVTLSTLDGSATLGNTTITGNLTIPNGSISNAALASPLSPLAFHADAQNFALGNGANLPIITQTINVPAGFTQAVVNVTASISAANSTAATDTLYCGCLVGGSGPGYSGRVGVSPGSAANPSKAAGVLLTGLGSSFTIQCTGSTGVAPWPANANNNANLDGTVIFLR